MQGRIDLFTIMRSFPGRIAVTCGIVLIENILIALVPLLIGLTIDGLLAGRLEELGLTVFILTALCGIAVARRIYDTRVYGTIRLHLGTELQKRLPALDVSARSARLDMSREIVDFLEEGAPALITAVIQILVSLAILSSFDWKLGAASLAVVSAMILFYGCFHGRFYHGNAELNAQREKQVDALAAGKHLGVFRHLRALRHHEVRISDTEAIVYGGIFLLQVAFIASNLLFGAAIPNVTAGQIFSIATYSWEFVEAALLLPLALQNWSRLSEIIRRLNILDQQTKTIGG